MKHIKLGVVFILILMVLALSSCGRTQNDVESDSQSDTADVLLSDSSFDSGSEAGPDEDAAQTTGDDEGETDEKEDSDESRGGTETDQKVTTEAVTTTAHTHSFVGATCTQAGKCSCGATDAPLGHSFAGAACTEAATCTRCGAKGSALGHDFTAATCTAPSTCSRCKTTNGSALGHSYSGGRCQRCSDTNGPLTPEEAALFKNKLSDEENAKALAVARSLVAQIEKEYPNGSDFDKIAMAAALVSEEYHKGVHVESGIYYSTAYGVFVKRESSCAGCCRALGLVLSCMGYKWTHVNENLWQHQWVTVTVNGETIWADGQIGWAGYGEYPYA